jgi:amino acid transporter
MAEEIKDAGKTVPRAMLGAYLMNGALGIVFLVSYMFMVTDVDAAINDPSGYPHMWVFSQAVSAGGVIALNTIPTVLIFAGTLSYNLSTSRQTWAFARDKGLPFSSWIGHVDPKLQVPKNAVTATCIITIALSLINIGSDVAFNASTYTFFFVSLTCRSSNTWLTINSYLPQCRISNDNVHFLHWRRARPPHPPPRTSTRVPLVSRQMGRSY